MAQFNEFEEIIDFTFWREICERHGEKVYFRRGDFFAHAHDVLKRVGWIVSGAFKHSIVDNAGNSKTVGFVFQGSILANYMSAMTGRPLPADIIALEDSEVLVVPASMIREHLVLDPTLHVHFLQVLFDQAYRLRLNDYRSTPEERYRQLASRFPRIFDLVSLGEIASYLNISRRQLHRFRLER